MERASVGRRGFLLVAVGLPATGAAQEAHGPHVPLRGWLLFEVEAGLGLELRVP